MTEGSRQIYFMDQNELNKLLLAAVLDKDLEQIRSLLDKGASLTAAPDCLKVDAITALLKDHEAKTIAELRSESTLEANTSADANTDGEKFPWEDIEAAQADAGLQSEYPIAKGQKQYGKYAKRCPKCNASVNQLRWVYFSSPKYTWENLCGRAGWLTVCDRCHVQVDFFCELLN